ncbi:hypothetical protein Mnod_2393 [Methylobacterium nodulans ORS 2060]|uniref:Uncharacterized protein n=1 Tax=Methylobacterium nodulans (strain LMG 21967 / CNCM I-2342 / ORS 2060) TaxID=460265 RepID=B8IBF2_METNO|nr:hypothetical protein Mnod_2393 [Methylobacterium nodulans ORS 2060]
MTFVMAQDAQLPRELAGCATTYFRTRARRRRARTAAGTDPAAAITAEFSGTGPERSRIVTWPVSSGRRAKAQADAQENAARGPLAHNFASKGVANRRGSRLSPSRLARKKAALCETAGSLGRKRPKRAGTAAMPSRLCRFIVSQIAMHSSTGPEWYAVVCCNCGTCRGSEPSIRPAVRIRVGQALPSMSAPAAASGQARIDAGSARTSSRPASDHPGRRPASSGSAFRS